MPSLVLGRTKKKVFIKVAPSGILFCLLLSVVLHKLTEVGSCDVGIVPCHVKRDFLPQAPTHHRPVLNPSAKSSARINIVKEKHSFPSSFFVFQHRKAQREYVYELLKI